MSLDPQRHPSPLPSEGGLFELVERRTGLDLEEALIAFRDLVAADMDWADSRKRRFRRRAAIVKIGSLGLTAASTIVLGIPSIPNRAFIALPMVTVTALLGGIDLFNGWRSRWVLMEEAQFRFNGLRDEIDILLVAGPSARLTQKRLDRFFWAQQEIWADVSRRWVQFRRTAEAREVAREL